jgi:hypothetical protein
MKNTDVTQMTQNEQDQQQTSNNQPRTTTTTITATNHHTYNQTNLKNLHNTTAHLPVGDTLTTKNKGTLRLYLQNINGAKLTQQHEAWEHAINYIKTNEIDYVGLVETRIDWNLNYLNIVQNQLKQKFSNRFLTTSMCSPNPLNDGTPGGTASILVNQIFNRKTNTIPDLLD